ncbi:MAG: MlaE family lipid ABC transporter permease subunit [Archangium sp.]|nr:MlaE family lipid ABC transporter permease subunit [Archangium sp.]
MPETHTQSQVELAGQLTFTEVATLWAELGHRVSTVTPGQRLDFDMSKVEAVDGGSMALLVQLRADLHRRGATSEFVGAAAPVQEIIHLYRGDVRVGALERPPARGMLEQIGAAVLAMADEAKQVLAFFGQSLLAIFGAIRRPSTANWKELAPTMERMGADAVPIVALINFLVGFVMAYQGAIQLKQFGANIYVADLVGLSICRELGPLMTAIIICGRSGAAFAAEIGTMKVSEEIDALRTMGFDPLRFLVLPRTLALMLVVPLLTLLGDAFGVLGGLAVGVMSLDLTVLGYFTETQQALDLWDVFSGVIKSVVFAGVVALIACQQGLATSGGALGVGKRTTSSVVTILFTLILVDAGFSVLFHALDL